MPKEENFEKIKRPEDFLSSIEGNQKFHDIYLKAINNPFRREVLKIINKEGQLSQQNLLEILNNKDYKYDINILKYNLDYLIKAFCIEVIIVDNNKYYQITQSGKIVEFLE